MTELPHPSLAAVLTYVRSVLVDLTPAQQAVALTVASHYSHREGCARPSQPALARELGWHEDTVYRAVRAVELAGVWCAERRPPRATRYRFPIAGAVHNPRATAGVDPSTTPASARGNPRGGAGDTPASARGEQRQEQRQRTRAALASRWCTPECATCGGIGWIEHGDPDMRMSAPCPEREAWAQ